MASTYKAYLGEGLGPLEWIKQFQIPHPGRVIGRAVLHLTMPSVLDWVLGGNNSHLARVRPSACRVEDRLKVGWRMKGSQHVWLGFKLCGQRWGCLSWVSTCKALFVPGQLQ
jgi:hypothetical protein